MGKDSWEWEQVTWAPNPKLLEKCLHCLQSSLSEKVELPLFPLPSLFLPGALSSIQWLSSNDGPFRFWGILDCDLVTDGQAAQHWKSQPQTQASLLFPPEVMRKPVRPLESVGGGWDRSRNQGLRKPECCKSSSQVPSLPDVMNGGL